MECHTSGKVVQKSCPAKVAAAAAKHLRQKRATSGLQPRKCCTRAVRENVRVPSRQRQRLVGQTHRVLDDPHERGWNHQVQCRHEGAWTGYRITKNLCACAKCGSMRLDFGRDEKQRKYR